MSPGLLSLSRLRLIQECGCSVLPRSFFLKAYSIPTKVKVHYRNFGNFCKVQRKNTWPIFLSPVHSATVRTLMISNCYYFLSIQTNLEDTRDRGVQTLSWRAKVTSFPSRCPGSWPAPSIQEAPVHVASRDAGLGRKNGSRKEEKCQSCYSNNNYKIYFSIMTFFLEVSRNVKNVILW